MVFKAGEQLLSLHLKKDQGFGLELPKQFLNFHNFT